MGWTLNVLHRWHHQEVGPRGGSYVTGGVPLTGIAGHQPFLSISLLSGFREGRSFAPPCTPPCHAASTQAPTPWSLLTPLKPQTNTTLQVVYLG